MHSYIGMAFQHGGFQLFDKQAFAANFWLKEYPEFYRSPTAHREAETAKAHRG